MYIKLVDVLLPPFDPCIIPKTPGHHGTMALLHMLFRSSLNLTVREELGTNQGGKGGGTRGTKNRPDVLGTTPTDRPTLQENTYMHTRSERPAKDRKSKSSRTITSRPSLPTPLRRPSASHSFPESAVGLFGSMRTPSEVTQKNREVLSHIHFQAAPSVPTKRTRFTPLIR